MFLSGLCLMRIMSMYFNYVMDIFETWIVKGVDFIFKAFKINRMSQVYILLYIIRKCWNQICPKIISHLGFSSLYLIASLFMLSLASSKIFPWKIFVSAYEWYMYEDHPWEEVQKFASTSFLNCMFEQLVSKANMVISGVRKICSIPCY